LQRGSLDGVLWSFVMTATADASQWEFALQLLDDMVAWRLRADSVSLNVRLAAAAHGGWQSALRELLVIATSGCVDLVGWSSAINTCGQAGRW
ncbi:unnamed protein product, partial [Symbiodinium pilosum]